MTRASARRVSCSNPHRHPRSTHPVHWYARYVVLSFSATFLSFSRRPLLLLPPAPPPVPASSRARCPSPFVTADPTGTARCVHALAPARWPFALLRVAIFRFSSFPHDASRMAPFGCTDEMASARSETDGRVRGRACFVLMHNAHRRPVSVWHRRHGQVRVRARAEPDG